MICISLLGIFVLHKIISDSFQSKPGRIVGWFYGYEEAVTAKRFDCISFQGEAGFAANIILQKNETARWVVFSPFFIGSG